MTVWTTKYELWNALFMTPEKEKTEATRKLEDELQKGMNKPGLVFVDIRDDSA